MTNDFDYTFLISMLDIDDIDRGETIIYHTSVSVKSFADKNEFIIKFPKCDDFKFSLSLDETKKFCEFLTFCENTKPEERVFSDFIKFKTIHNHHSHKSFILKVNEWDIPVCEDDLNALVKRLS